MFTNLKVTGTPMLNGRLQWLLEHPSVPGSMAVIGQASHNEEDEVQKASSNGNGMEIAAIVAATIDRHPEDVSLNMNQLQILQQILMLQERAAAQQEEAQRQQNLVVQQVENVLERERAVQVREKACDEREQINDDRQRKEERFIFDNYGDTCPRCITTWCDACGTTHLKLRCPARGQRCIQCKEPDHYRNRCPQLRKK